MREKRKRIFIWYVLMHNLFFEETVVSLAAQWIKIWVVLIRNNEACRLHDKTLRSSFFVLFWYKMYNDFKLPMTIKATTTTSTTRTREKVLRRSLLYFTIRLSIKFSLHFLYSPFSPSKYLKTKHKYALQTHAHIYAQATHTYNVVIYLQILDRTQMIRFII